MSRSFRVSSSGGRVGACYRPRCGQLSESRVRSGYVRGETVPRGLEVCPPVGDEGLGGSFEYVVRAGQPDAAEDVLGGQSAPDGIDTGEGPQDREQIAGAVLGVASRVGVLRLDHQADFMTRSSISRPTSSGCMALPISRLLLDHARRFLDASRRCNAVQLHVDVGPAPLSPGRRCGQCVQPHSAEPRVHQERAAACDNGRSETAGSH